MKNWFEIDGLKYPKLKLKMIRPDFQNIPEMSLPLGYRFSFYEKGDRDHWIEIQMSAGVFSAYDEGLAVWNTYFEPWSQELSRRMIFIENTHGEKIATASAYFDIHGFDPDCSGRVHWVAVKKDFQRNKLSKPLVCHVLTQLQTLGYAFVYLTTQTSSWIACKVYLDLGFVPDQENEFNTREGWNVVLSLTKHEKLDEILNRNIENSQQIC